MSFGINYLHKPVSFFLLLSGILFSCSESGTSTHLAANLPVEQPKIRSLEYIEFRPDTLPKVNISGFYTVDSYQLGSLAVLTGYYEYPDGKIVYPNTEKDFGLRLLAVDKQQHIRFQSRGSGDVYSFDPHFYRNPQSAKIYIICQEAFEYYCGADIFLFEMDQIKHLGIMDLSGKDEETNLVDILHISELGNKTIFSFEADSLTFNPGGEKESVIKNTNIHYIYDGNHFRFIR